MAGGDGRGVVVVGLTGTVILLARLYLIAVGAWAIHRGLLGVIIAFTALLAVGALTLPWVRTELWGRNGSAKDGLVPRDALPWLRGTWWACGPARRHSPAQRPDKVVSCCQPGGTAGVTIVCP